MAKEEYRIGQKKQTANVVIRPPEGPGPGPGMGGGGEKANDFTGTWKKFLRYCRTYWGVIIGALICAGTGTVLTLVGPDKLSEMTDLITKGMMTEIDLTAIATIGLLLAAIYGISLQGRRLAPLHPHTSERL